jgi:hypothetical protein
MGEVTQVKEDWKRERATSALIDRMIVRDDRYEYVAKNEVLEPPRLYRPCSSRRLQPLNLNLAAAVLVPTDI